MKRLTLVVVALLAVGSVLLVGCGDDSDGGSTETTSQSDSGSDGSGDAETDSGSSGTAGPEVEAFCESVAEFVDLAEQVAADPTNQELATEFASRASALTGDAVDLSGSATIEDSDRLTDCVSQLTDARQG